MKSCNGDAKINMRVDKFLKNSRLIKRRTVAKEACDQGRVSINNKQAKAGSEVEIDDIVHIEFGNNSISVKVLKLSEGTRKEDAQGMYEVVI